VAAIVEKTEFGSSPLELVIHFTADESDQFVQLPLALLRPGPAGSTLDTGTLSATARRPLEHTVGAWKGQLRYTLPDYGHPQLIEIGLPPGYRIETQSNP
jgi:hypothetical protein